MKDNEDENGFLLNMQMLVDDLEECCNVEYFVRRNDEQKLAYANAYYGQKDLDEKVVYVGEAEIFDRYPIQNDRICRIINGTPERRPEQTGYSVIEVEPSGRWEELLNNVQAIFWRYSSWVNRLSSILNEGGTLYELCVAAVDFFKNPLYVHDPEFNVLAMPTWVVGMGTVTVDSASGNMVVPLEKVQFFHSNREYLQTLSTYGAQIWNPARNSHRVLYVNIWGDHQKYCGRFLINELGVSLKPSTFTMAEYFAKILTMAWKKDMLKSTSKNSFEKILQDVYEKKGVERGYLLRRLKMIGWKPEHAYVCFQIQPEEKEASAVTGKRLCSAAGICLKQSFSFPEGNRVFTVCNLTLAGYHVQDCRQQLSELREITEVIIGTSNPFHDFLMLEEYYRQAEKAIELGYQKDKKKRFYLFSDYALDYIITHFTEEFAPESVGSQAIRELQKIDKEKNTAYLETLKYYFDNNCQQSQTAQAMYIHRSTLTYRLERIEKLTGVHLNDPEERLYMQISMRLMENN